MMKTHVNEIEERMQNEFDFSGDAAIRSQGKEEELILYEKSK